MSDKKIHLEITPQQATTLSLSLELAKQMLAVAPGTAVYPNLGDFKLERDLIHAELKATREELIRQLEPQMPKE